MFFKNKVLELQRKNDYLERENKELKELVEYLKKQISGCRLSGEYCRFCENGYQSGEYTLLNGVSYKSWKCILDCTCKQFNKKPDLF